MNDTDGVYHSIVEYILNIILTCVVVCIMIW